MSGKEHMDTSISYQKLRTWDFTEKSAVDIKQAH